MSPSPPPLTRGQRSCQHCLHAGSPRHSSFSVTDLFALEVRAYICQRAEGLCTVCLVIHINVHILLSVAHIQMLLAYLYEGGVRNLP